MKTKFLCVICAVMLVICALTLFVACGLIPIIGVEYDVGGGELPSDAPKTYIRGSIPDFSKVVPTRENYNFGGWFTDEDLTVEFSSDTKVDMSLKLYAKWNACQYSISYELSEGTCDNLPEKYTYGETVSLSDFQPNKEGFIFGGWFMDKEFELSADTIERGTSGDIIIYAKWMSVPALISQIPNITKGCFPNSTSSEKIDLSKYINKNGALVEYNVSSSDTNVVKTSVYGDELLLNFVNNEGYSDITIDVLVEKTKYFSCSFRATSKAYLKVACIGDSLTASTPAYADYLNEYLDPSVIINNCGQSGIAVSQYSNTDGMGPYKEICSRYSSCIEFNPDLIIIMLGTNDATKVASGVPKYEWDSVKAEIKSAYLDLIRSLRSGCPNADIVILTSPPVADNNKLNISNDVLESGTYPLQKEIADEANAILVDTRRYVKGIGDYESFYRDGVHFTEDSGRQFAEFVVKSIRGK